MDYEMIENKVKDFCKEMLADSLKLSDPKDKLQMRAIAFGAVQFACSNLFPGYNHNLSDWWSGFMFNFLKGV